MNQANDKHINALLAALTNQRNQALNAAAQTQASLEVAHANNKTLQQRNTVLEQELAPFKAEAQLMKVASKPDEAAA